MRKSAPYQTGDQALVRQINLSLILHILRTDAPISRASLSQKTKLNKTTVSDLISELDERGFVRELGMQSSGTGRPATMLTLNPGAGFIVSCEIAVDYLEVLVTDFGPDVIWQAKEATPANTDQQIILTRLIDMLHAAIEKGRTSSSKLLGIALGVPGMIDQESGTLLFAPNLKWLDVPLLDILEKQNFGGPIFVDNEANLAALGEYYFGVARGYKEILYLSGNVGLGGGLLRDGQLCRGANGVAAEFGHMTMDPQGALCNCGNYGCWETQVSQTSLINIVIAGIRGGESSLLTSIRDGQLEYLTVDMIVKAAQAGDALALSALEKTGRFLGIGIASLLNALNPEIVVLGGILSEAAEFLFPAANDEINKRTLPWNRKTVKIVQAAHGSDACVKGGIAAVYESVLSLQPAINFLS